MLTKHPNIVTAYTPKRTRQKRKAPILKVPVIVEARDPRRIKRKPALATRIIE